mgnify:CR=1 FL=1
MNNSKKLRIPALILALLLSAQTLACGSEESGAETTNSQGG